MHSFMAFDIARTLLILILVSLAYIDLRTFRLPDAITIPTMTAGLVFNYLAPFGFADFPSAIWGAILGYLFLWGLNWVYRAVKKQNGIGLGDAKLLSALGAWLGLNAIPNILLIASLAGLIGGFVWLQLQKQSIRSAFPFGPFLAIAGIIEMLWPKLLQTLFLNNPI